MERRDFPDGAAVIAGGSGGIGRAIAAELVRAGTRVAVTYRTGRAAAEELQAALGDAVSIHAVELGDPASVEAMIAEVAHIHGAIHTAVHAAGSDLRMRWVSEVTPDEWRAATHGDADGCFHLIRAVLPHLRASRGSVVAVTSAGLVRYPSRDILSVAPKAAIEALIRGVAREEGRHGVRANSIAVGVVDAGVFERLTARGELSPAWLDAARKNAALGRIGAARDVADAVVFLASARAGFVTGQRLAVDGGYAI